MHTRTCSGIRDVRHETQIAPFSALGSRLSVLGLRLSAPGHDGSRSKVESREYQAACLSVLGVFHTFAPTSGDALLRVRYRAKTQAGYSHAQLHTTLPVIAIADACLKTRLTDECARATRDSLCRANGHRSTHRSGDSSSPRRRPRSIRLSSQQKERRISLPPRSVRGTVFSEPVPDAVCAMQQAMNQSGLYSYVEQATVPARSPERRSTSR
jgi:hypothetical protein